MDLRETEIDEPILNQLKKISAIIEKSSLPILITPSEVTNIFAGFKSL